jgi:hypothetical protein
LRSRSSSRPGRQTTRVPVTTDRPSFNPPRRRWPLPPDPMSTSGHVIFPAQVRTLALLRRHHPPPPGHLPVCGPGLPGVGGNYDHLGGLDPVGVQPVAASTAAMLVLPLPLGI